MVSNTVNAGETPVYQWIIGGLPMENATENVFSYMPVNGDIISCVLTSSAACVSSNPVTSNAITMVMTPVLIPSVTVTAVPD
jgi:hypothetical protein